MSTPPSSRGTCKCNRKQVKGEYISVHQPKYLQSPSLCHPNVLYAPDLFCAIVILSWNLIFLSPGTCMWLFYYTTKFHFLSSAEIKLGLEDTVYKGCSDKPDPRRWGVKPSTLGGHSRKVGHQPQSWSKQRLRAGYWAPYSHVVYPIQKNHPLGTHSKPKDSNFQFLAW